MYWYWSIYLLSNNSKYIDISKIKVKYYEDDENIFIKMLKTLKKQEIYKTNDKEKRAKDIFKIY